MNSGSMLVTSPLSPALAVLRIAQAQQNNGRTPSPASPQEVVESAMRRTPTLANVAQRVFPPGSDAKIRLTS